MPFLFFFFLKKKTSFPQNHSIQYIISHIKTNQELTPNPENSSSNLSLHRISRTNASTGNNTNPSWQIQVPNESVGSGSGSGPEASLAFPLSFPGAHDSEIVRDAYSPDDVSSHFRSIVLFYGIRFLLYRCFFLIYPLLPLQFISSSSTLSPSFSLLLLVSPSLSLFLRISSTHIKEEQIIKRCI